MKFLSLALLCSLSVSLAACGGTRSNGSRDLYRSKQYEVTPQTFMSGDRFCEMYGKGEFGKWVNVPKDYARRGRGLMKIYVYSKKPFNPYLPTFIFVDGGPGQNTHGAQPMLNGEVNELRFDQRGLGCSTPRTFDEYFDHTLYSTSNTAEDMDLIRKAYGLSTWSVYGLSYGTQPATVYASKFSAHVRSLILEGVVSSPEFAHQAKYKIEKWNTVISSLNYAQKQALRNLIYEEDDNGKSTPDSDVVWGLFDDSSYRDVGLQTLKRELEAIFSTDGSVNRSLILQIRKMQYEYESRYKTAQRPMGVDRNIHLMIECKEFAFRTVPSNNINFDYNSMSFVEIPAQRALARRAEACDKVRVKSSDVVPYDFKKYPTTSPVYYFQGSHDGATTALGAFEHWKEVPKGQVSFALAKLGGHNPALSSLRRGPESRAAQQSLLLKALRAEPMIEADFKVANDHRSDQYDWVFFSGAYNSSATYYLSGI